MTTVTQSGMFRQEVHNLPDPLVNGWLPNRMLVSGLHSMHKLHNTDETCDLCESEAEEAIATYEWLHDREHVTYSCNYCACPAFYNFRNWQRRHYVYIANKGGM